VNNDQEIKGILREILKWTKFQGMQNVKQVLEDTLDTETKKLVYELSNGTSSPRIAKIAGVDPTTVRDYWKDWVVLGIAETHPDYKKRYRRVFSLKEIGIAVPEVEETIEQTEEEQSEDE
jgi:hypothetical protein